MWFISVGDRRRLLSAPLPLSLSLNAASAPCDEVAAGVGAVRMLKAFAGANEDARTETPSISAEMKFVVLAMDGKPCLSFDK